jgi:hypothetical protein
MPYLKEVVDQINLDLKEGILFYSPFIPLLNGISELIPLEEGGDTSSFPAMYNDDGVGEWAGANDRYNLVAYHRCLGRTFGVDADVPNFGDSFDNHTETNQMLLCVWAERETLRLTKEEIQDKIVQGLPTNLSAQFQYDYDGINGVWVAATEINTNARSVWNEEFSGYDYKLSTSQVLFTVAYTVEIKYRKSCISDCKEC